MEGESNAAESVEVVIRSAMQTFPDRKIICSLDWTILQLKEHLNKILPFKPEVPRQRLIYAGHCLESTNTIRAVLKGRAETGFSETPDVTQVFHLVYSSREALQSSLSSTNTSGLRHRTNVASTASTTSTPSSFYAQAGPDMANAQNFYGGAAGFNYAQYSQNPYDYYAAYYQNYMNQMAMHQQQYFMAAQQSQFAPQFQQGAFPFPQAGNLFAAGGVAAAVPNFAGVAQAHQPVFAGAGGGFGAAIRFNANNGRPVLVHNGANVAANFGGDPAAMAAAVAAAIQANGFGAGIPPQAAQNVGAAAGGGVRGNRPDILDMIYKAIRFMLLLMVLYVYSSFERFFAVLVSISLIWFVQRQRERRNRNLAAAAAAQNVPRQRANENNINENEQQENLLNENNENEARREAEDSNDGVAEVNAAAMAARTDAGTAVAPTPGATNPWTLAWSAVSSFFSSLIPENPMPVN